MIRDYGIPAGLFTLAGVLLTFGLQAIPALFEMRVHLRELEGDLKPSIRTLQQGMAGMNVKFSEIDKNIVRLEGSGEKQSVKLEGFIEKQLGELKRDVQGSDSRIREIQQALARIEERTMHTDGTVTELERMIRALILHQGIDLKQEKKMTFPRRNR